MVKNYYHIQRGSGRYYKIQRGRGLGSFLRRIFKFTVPIVKNIASNKTVKKLGKEIVNRGLESAKDVMQGEPVKNVIKREKNYLKDKAVKVINKVSKKINENDNNKTKQKTKFNTNNKKKKKNKKKNQNKKLSPYLF